MPDNISQEPPRPWRVIAEEALHEHDASKMTELIVELNQALEQQGLTEPINDGRQKNSA